MWLLLDLYKKINKNYYMKKEKEMCTKIQAKFCEGFYYYDCKLIWKCGELNLRLEK